MKYEINVELNLKNIIEEARKVSRTLYKLADELEMIEKKYAELQKVEVEE